MIPLMDENPTSRFAVVTVLLIVANVFVFVFIQERDDPTFALEFAAVPCELREGRPLDRVEVEVTYFGGFTDACNIDDGRSAPVFPDKNVYLAVLTSMFLHADWLHLGFNMLFLWIFGNNIEDHMGRLRYLLFYLLGGGVATAAHAAANLDSTVPLIGASGAVAAVMGAYFIWFPNAPVRTLIFILLVDVRAKWLLGAWLVLQFFTDVDSGVAWVAHVGGFVYGAAVGLLVRMNSAVRRLAWRRRYRTVGRWDDTGGVGAGPYPRFGDRRFGGRDW